MSLITGGAKADVTSVSSSIWEQLLDICSERSRLDRARPFRNASVQQHTTETSSTGLEQNPTRLGTRRLKSIPSNKHKLLFGRYRAVWTLCGAHTPIPSKTQQFGAEPLQPEGRRGRVVPAGTSFRVLSLVPRPFHFVSLRQLFVARRQNFKHSVCAFEEA